eukprot:g82672.t1
MFRQEFRQPQAVAVSNVQCKPVSSSGTGVRRKLPSPRSASFKMPKSEKSSTSSPPSHPSPASSSPPSHPSPASSSSDDADNDVPMNGNTHLILGIPDYDSRIL